jgi:hypothetical protein
MYEYKGERSIEAWTKFTEEGYKTAEALNIPAGPGTDWMKAWEPINKIKKEILYLIDKKPWVFASLIGSVIFLTYLTIKITAWLADKIAEPDENERLKKVE